MTKYGWRDGSIKPKKLVVQDKMPVQYVIPRTDAESTNAVLAGHDFNATGTAALTNTGLVAQPPYPARLVISAMVAGTAAHDDELTIVGEDAFGDTISEAVYLKATAAASTATSYAFAKIDSITPNQTVKSTSVGIGIKKQIGLPWPVETNDDIISYTYDGTYATTAVDDLTVDATYAVLTMPTMAAAKTMQVLYKSKVQK